MNDIVETTCVELREFLGVFMAQMMRYDTDMLLRYVRQAELTLPMLAVLAVVEREGALSIGELGARLDYSLANASLLVDKLVCQGYVTRIENASDRRHKQVQLTAHGRALLIELSRTRGDSIARQLLLLPPDLLRETIELLRTITNELPLPEPRRAIEILDTAAE